MVIFFDWLKLKKFFRFKKAMNIIQLPIIWRQFQQKAQKNKKSFFLDFFFADMTENNLDELNNWIVDSKAGIFRKF